MKLALLIMLALGIGYFLVFVKDFYEETITKKNINPHDD